MKKNDLCELEIYEIAEDGSGIGRYDGFIIFCRGMLPGERGSVRIMKVTKSYAVGKMLSRSISSPRRIDPPICSNFVRGCGGCTFCHLIILPNSYISRNVFLIVSHASVHFPTPLPLFSPCWRRNPFATIGTSPFILSQQEQTV